MRIRFAWDAFLRNAEGGAAGGAGTGPAGGDANASAGNAGGGAGGDAGPGSQAPANASWFQALPDNLKGSEHIARHAQGELADLLTAYDGLARTSKVSPDKLIELPADGKLEPVLERLGAPTDPNAYDLGEVPDTMKQGADWFKGAAKDAKLLPSQAQALWNALQAVETQDAANKEAAKQAQFDEWKAQAEQKYGGAIDNVISEASFVAGKYGLTDVLNEAGLGAHPGVIELLAFAARHMSEGGEGSPGGSGGAPDPSRMTPETASARGRELISQSIAASRNGDYAGAKRLNSEAQRYFAIAANGKT